MAINRITTSGGDSSYINRSGAIKKRRAREGDITFGGDPQFTVRAKAILGADASRMQKLIRKHFYVRMDLDGLGQVDVNIRSLSKRLYLNKKLIRDMASDAKGIQTWAEDISKVLNGYKTLFEQYKNSSWQLFKREGLSKGTLMKVVKLGVELPQNSERKVRVGRHHFLISKEGDAFRAERFSHVLGRGTFGKVTLLKALGQPKTAVIKTAEPSRLIDRKDAEDSIEREYTVLEKAHRSQAVGLRKTESGELIGIMAKPLKFFKIAGVILSSFVGVRYEGTLKKLYRAKPDVKNQVAHQLLQGLSNLKKLQIAHLDIKPENVFVKKDERGNWIAHIADFGGVFALEEGNVTSLNKNWGATMRYAAPYVDSFASEAVQGSAAMFDPNTSENIYRCDLHSMGLTLYELYTGRQPEPSRLFGRNFAVKEEFVRRELAKAGAPEYLQTAILAMIAPKAKHCSIDQILANFPL